MTAYLSPVFDTQFFDGSTVAAGYKLYTYESGTTTPKAVYSDQAGTVPHTNPIVLDANGRVAGQMFLGSGEYTFTLKTSDDVLVKTWNDVAGSGTANEAAAYDSAIRSDLASTSDSSKGAGMVGFKQSGAGAVARTLLDKGRDVVSVKDFGAKGDGVTDDSASIAAAQVAATTVGAVLYFPAGTYKCNSVTLKDIRVDGVILSTGTTTATAVVLAGSISAPETRQIFSHSVAAPTNLPGTTVPFMFSASAAKGMRVSVMWFGAKGDNTTDDTAALNFCATAMSFSIAGGTPYSPLQGPVEMYFPRGNYRVGGTVCITNGTLMRGQSSGSNPLSTLIRDEVAIGSASAADMIWIVKDNQNYTGNAQQAFFKDLSFIWRPTSEFGSSTLQLDTAFIAFKASSISVKMNGCWFLGSPQKGAIFSWGNDYLKDGSGTGIVKKNTGTDADGIYVDISTSDTWFDVIYGTIANVYDKGWGNIQNYNSYTYQLWLTFVLNYSTHSTNRVMFSMDGGTIYGACVQLAPTYREPSTGTLTTTAWKESRNVDLFFNNMQIRNKNMNGQSFCFSLYPYNSSVRMVGNFIDSTDTTAQYSTQPFKLDWRANSLILIGNEWYGSMTPNPATLTAPWPKAFISKLTGTVSANGATAMIYLSGNKIDIGTMDYFIDKEAAYSLVDNFYCVDNYIPVASAKFVFNTTGATKYVMARNVWLNTANSLEAIP